MRVGKTVEQFEGQPERQHTEVGVGSHTVFGNVVLKTTNLAAVTSNKQDWDSLELDVKVMTNYCFLIL